MTMINRTRVKVSPDQEIQEIVKQWGVSSATAWRAKKRGWLCPNYRKREIRIDSAWAEAHIEEIQKSARIGALQAVKLFARSTGLSSARVIFPFELDDIVQVGILRLLELSGDDQNRGSPYWRSKVAFNAASDFIKVQCINKGKRQVPLEIDDRGEYTSQGRIPVLCNWEIQPTLG